MGMGQSHESHGFSVPVSVPVTVPVPITGLVSRDSNPMRFHCHRPSLVGIVGVFIGYFA